jgi:rod shape-determining protein MreC
MEFLSRYRNLSVLLLLIFAQLLLLAYQVKTAQDVRLIRVWAVTAVTPVARLLEGARSTVTSFVESYLLLHNAVEENRRLRAEIGRLKLENQYLKNELATAERARALACSRRATLRRRWPRESSERAWAPHREWSSWIAVPPAASCAGWP